MHEFICYAIKEYGPDYHNHGGIIIVSYQNCLNMCAQIRSIFVIYIYPLPPPHTHSQPVTLDSMPVWYMGSV